jgi:hypothetical protein
VLRVGAAADLVHVTWRPRDAYLHLEIVVALGKEA